MAAPGFNEAAGIPRGRRRRWGSQPSRATDCFNEAAGIPRGRRALADDGICRSAASMRPRVFPAEDEAIKVIEAWGLSLLQ